MQHNELPLTGFDEMNLSEAVLSAVQASGYTEPTPIQVQAIPPLNSGKDILGQAQTGTGKTAAFALPILSRIDVTRRIPQVLVLTPTRELAVQVADSFVTYGSHLKGLSVLPVYGGQGYGTQLAQLKRGAHVIVGTPGRLMDHMKRNTICLDGLFCVVLDEADEMLHMGFIDDVEWILEQTPETVQKALFSATLPGPIRKIAKKHLEEPVEITIASGPREKSTINQKYLVVKNTFKKDALVRILSATTFDAMIVFVNTKAACSDLAAALEQNGFKAEALNGDIAQSSRERTVQRLKTGAIDILVATDVAARGLDVDRISHVVNVDMPARVEPYVHRIGRTGRAGRTGEAILFVKPNELRVLKTIERVTKKAIARIELPTNRDINEKRTADFKKAIADTLASQDLEDFQTLITDTAGELELPMAAVAAALAKMAHGPAPLLLPVEKEKTVKKPRAGKAETPVQAPVRKKAKSPAEKKPTSPKAAARNKTVRTKDKDTAVPNESLRLIPPEKGMQRYRVEVGRRHGVMPGDIVGAIANEAGLESRYIGKIDISRDFSLVDLPTGMPDETFRVLQKTWVKSRRMSISLCA